MDEERARLAKLIEAAQEAENAAIVRHMPHAKNATPVDIMHLMGGAARVDRPAGWVIYAYNEETEQRESHFVTQAEYDKLVKAGEMREDKLHDALRKAAGS